MSNMMNSKHIFLSGHRGFLGSKLKIELNAVPDFSVGYWETHDYKNVDFSNPARTNQIPQCDYLINCAGMSNVDQCEKEPANAWYNNVEIIKNLCDRCKEDNTTLIHFSSDYVLQPRLNWYATCKAMQEYVIQKELKNYLIIRTSSLFGYSNVLDKTTFTKWFIINGKETNLGLPDNMKTCPTFIDDLAFNVIRYIKHEWNPKEKIVNIVGSECLSKLEFAQKINKVFDLNAELYAIKKEDIATWIAARPDELNLLPDKDTVITNVEDALTIMKEQMNQ